MNKVYFNHQRNENNKLRRCLLDLRQKEKLEDYEFSTSDREEVRKIETKLKMLSVHGHEVITNKFNYNQRPTEKFSI